MSCEGESLQEMSNSELLKHGREHYRMASEVVEGRDDTDASLHGRRLREILAEVFMRSYLSDPARAQKIVTDFMTERIDNPLRGDERN